MEITETVHCLEQPMREIFTACYLILGKKITLIDSGLPETCEKLILPYLKKLKRDPRDISLIAHTHNHGDHVGSDRALKEISGAEIAIHEAGVEALEHPEVVRARYLSEYGKYLSKEEQETIRKRPLGQPLRVDRHLRDGDVLDLGRMKLEVIHTPGHSPDCVCFYDRSRKTIFTGDSVVGGTTMIDDFVILQDVDAYLASISRLQKLDLKLMLMDHPYLPYETAILRDQQLRDYLEFSVDINAQIADQILATLKRAGKPMSAAEVSYIVCPIFRRKIPDGVTNRTILVQLLRLARLGSVAEDAGTAPITWALKTKSASPS